MITYLLDEMEDNYKILILYVLGKITEPEIRKNIWNKIQEYENLVLTEIINQEWNEELEEAYNNDELERVYNYDYTNTWDSGPETDKNMINYKYLSYWTETMLEIGKTEQNMKNDLDNYMQTKKIRHIESLNKNIKKLLLLKKLAKENYNLAFNQQ